MFWRIFIGVIGLAVGTLMVMRSEWFLSFFGRIDWAEIHLGTEGGTRVFYKILGLLTIFISLLIITGMIEGFVLAIFSPLIRK